MRDRLLRIARAPALHFVALGGLLHLAVAAWPVAGEIHVDRADLQRLQREWHTESGRAPTPPELRASLQRYLDDEILLAEALRLELDASDPVARARLLQNIAFAFPDGEGDEDTRIDQARALGMPSSDLVVRRRLIQLMEHRLVGDVDFDEASLRAYVSTHAARYAPPARLAFHQVYFSRDARADARAQAAATLEQLRTDASLAPAALGDPFLLGDPPLPVTPAWLERRYGPAFARAVGEAEAGEWIGPLETAYGWHLVRVATRDAAGEPDFDAVRVRAAYAWRAEEERRVLQQRLQPLRKRYGVASVEAVMERLRS
jgi:hypothetical protein